MKIKHITIICVISVLIILVYMSLANSNISMPDTYNIGISLRYPYCYDIKTLAIKKYNLYQISYKVKAIYPSRDVFVFYDTNLKRMGWTPFAEKDAASRYGIWQSFIDNTRRGAPKIYQLLAKWKKKDVLICLSLRYYSSNQKCSPGNDVEYVAVSVIPFNKVAPILSHKAVNQVPDLSRTTGGMGPSKTQPVAGRNARWTDLYDTFKMGIRHTDPTNQRKCEHSLYNILKKIDEKSYCKEDIDCTLLNQPPFGATVPIRRDAAPGVLLKMRSYKEYCDNATFYGVVHSTTKNEPACWDGRCMVKSVPGKVGTRLENRNK